MRPVKVTMNAAGYSQWVPIDYIESWFGVTIAVVLSEDASLTYTVQHTFDNTYLDMYTTTNVVGIARAATLATVTDNGPHNIGHGLTTGDSVIVKGSGSTYLDSPMATFEPGDLGWTVASTPTNKTYTYAVTNAGPTADSGNAHVVRLRVSNSTLVNQTVRASVTYEYPVQGVRLYVSSYTAGFADMIILQGISK